MNLKLYGVLFSIKVSTILLLNSGAVAPVKAVKHIIWKWDGNNFVQVPGALEHIAAGQMVLYGYLIVIRILIIYTNGMETTFNQYLDTLNKYL
jgi:hypothetical protein